MPADDTWSLIRAELERAVSDSVFHIWIEPLRLRGQDGNTLLLEAPDEIRTWVCDRFGGVLRSCTRSVLGPDADIAIGPPDRAHTGRIPEPARAEQPRKQHHTSLDLNPKFTFNQFVIGDGNRMAHSAALAVAEQPAHSFNPLFIYGRPGVGKTHLLHAIAAYVQAYGGGLRVRYTTIEEFTNHFVASTRGGGMDDFKRAYREADVLLIDDVQFLESKAKTEEEFFHTFNALYDTGAQLVITCDRLPRDLQSLADRLRERFEAGLVVDLQPPDLATRMTILRKRARHDDIPPISDDALRAIAERVTDNVRVLEGALIRVVARGSMEGRPLDRRLVLDVLGERARTTPADLTVEDIQRAVADAFGVTVEDLVSPRRTARISRPRQIAMLLARRHTPATLPAIGRAFGGRNHSTVLAACEAATSRLADDTELRHLVEGVESALTEPGADRTP